MLLNGKKIIFNFVYGFLERKVERKERNRDTCIM